MNRKNAFALPLVLWSVAFLTVISLVTVKMVDRWLDDETLSERRFLARQYALSGLAVGSNPDVDNGDKLLGSANAEHDGYKVRISDESGRLNPNFWLKEKSRQIFEVLFTAWEADKMLSDTAIDSMQDWVDGDDFSLLNGAERSYYAPRGMEGFPANRPFSSVRELTAVRGLDTILASRENWRDIFTLWNDGKISALHASAEVLEAVAGFSEGQAKAFIALRAGEDGVENTRDDRAFKSLGEIEALAGADAVQRERIEAFFDLGGGLRRIESTGWAGGTSYRISAIVAQGAKNGTYLHWEEQ